MISGNDAGLFILAVSKFCFVCAILLSLIVFVIKWIIFLKIKSISMSLISFTILASIFYALTSLFAGLYWICSINIISDELFENLCDIIQVFCWHLGQVMVYCYLFIRLYKGFKGSIYSVKSRTSIFLSILLCCYLLGCLIILGLIIQYIISYSLDLAKTIDDMPYSNELQISFKALTLVIDFILSVALLVIFVDKLNKVSKSFNEMIDNEYDLISDDDSNNDPLLVQRKKTLQTQNENIYNVISNVLVLGVIMIISSQITLTLSFVNWIRNEDTNDALTVVYGSFQGIHTLIASLSVLLGFEFTHNWYICCCGFCHKKTAYIIKNNATTTQSLQRYNKN